MNQVLATPIDDLRREHANMRSVLMLISNQLDKLERMGVAEYVLLANALYYMRKFPGRVHHPKEDMIFQRLEEMDPSWKTEVERVRAQHAEIYALEDELIERALDNPEPGSEACAELVQHGRRYLQLQRQHSESEERLLFPQALGVLQARDWASIRARIKQVDDPLFGNHGGGRYRLLYEQIMRDAEDT
ncbi:MAG TPA: hemerythrin domain-containing protein [Gammaproteobacteria bacterium]|jgi:hemerythrin-like domain-containing protein|nr:hemerythrin domain-containing protein [Gammaproteobacteria bacterium]